MLESLEIPFVRYARGDRLIDDDEHEHVVPEMVGACQCETQCEVDADLV